MFKSERKLKMFLITLTSLLDSELTVIPYFTLHPKFRMQCPKIWSTVNGWPHSHWGCGTFSKINLWVRYVCPIRNRVRITDSFLFNRSRFFQGFKSGLISFNLLFVTTSQSLLSFRWIILLIVFFPSILVGTKPEYSGSSNDSLARISTDSLFLIPTWPGIQKNI